jgi:phenylalanyl-tRNA synthetase alpha chain
MDEVNVLQQLAEIQSAALAQLEQVADEAALQAWKVAHLGRSSPVMLVFQRLPQYPKEERPAIGQRANQVKQALEAAFAARSQSLKEAALAYALQAEKLDVTLPGRRVTPGRLHPETQVLREIYHVLGEMGFQVYRSRDVETDEYNFSLINIPPHHPARDMWDTFHTTTPGILLRTHTSAGQIYVMRENAPDPVRVILPGMCYRYEQANARKDIQFDQVEMIAIGRSITFSDLKGTLTEFARRMFGDSVRARLRPSYFPFTEPSGEMDIGCLLCGGRGCAVCKGSGWVEILGCGMIHPTVLRNGGYDPSVYTGFAAGMGPARVAMLRHRIADIRYLWQNDLRFLAQF